MPVYIWECKKCPATFTEVRRMEDYDKPAPCPNPECGSLNTERLITNNCVMTAALPDGTKRFQDVKRYRELEREKAKTTDPESRAKIKQEQDKICGRRG